MKDILKEKGWCTYSYGLGPAGVARVISLNKGFAEIKYHDDQVYSSDYWDLNYLKLFNGILGAAVCYVKRNSAETSYIDFARRLIASFPNEKETLERFIRAFDEK